MLLKIQVFWDVTPCGLVNRMTFRRTAVKEVWGLDYLTLKMKAQRSFETSLINYRSTRRTHPSKSCCRHKWFLVSRLLIFPLPVWNHCDLQLLHPQSSCTFAMNYAFSLSLSFAELSHRASDAPTPNLRTSL